MTDIFASLRSAIQTARRGRPLLLLLDYDGTLVEIAPRPELAIPSPELLALLARLAAQPYLKVMVVSGRPLEDLQQLLPLPGLDFLASHGGEAFISGRLHPLPVAAAYQQELTRWRQQLQENLLPFQGWWLEDKPLGFALHYRQLPPEQKYEFLNVLAKWQEQPRQAAGLQLLPGKKVLEILPRGVSKGAAIQEILLLPGFIELFPIYLGDDFTDESAFQILAHRGLTIKVGPPTDQTAASYFLPDPNAVRHFLTGLTFPLEEL